MVYCHAKSKRSQKRCRLQAMRGKRVCHMHGGKSTGRKKIVDGPYCNGQWKHGLYSKALKKEYSEASIAFNKLIDKLR